MTKRILIVSYHFYPDTAVGAKRMSELARYLCGEGHEVVVVTASSARFISSDPALALDSPNLRCIRVPQPPKLLPAMLRGIKRLRPKRPGAPVAGDTGTQLANEGLLRRLKRVFHSIELLVDDKKLWSALAAVRLSWLALGKPFDAVISSGPPMTAHLAVLAVRPLLRARWTIDLRDPWTDQNHRPDIQSNISRKINRFLERSAFKSADALTVTTPGYGRVLREAYPSKQDQVHVVLNGFDGTVEPSAPPQGKLELLYAGSLYYNRNPFPLLEALGRLVERPDVDRGRVMFRLYGDCESWNGINLRGWIAQRGLDDCVSVHPPVAPSAVRELMVQSNVLVNFAQGQPMQIPAKMFDYISARRESLLVTEPDSDSAWLARQAGSVHIVAPGSEGDALDALTRLYDRYVRCEAGDDLDPSRLVTFSRARQNVRFLELLSGEVCVQQEARL